MIDFKNYTNAGLRNVTYNGVNSLSNLGVVITTDTTNVGELTPKSNTESLPFTHGDIDFTRIDGTLYYEARRLTYRFKCLAEDIDDLITMEQGVYNWLNSSGSFTIQDSDYPGYEFRDCVLKNVSWEPGENMIGCEYSYITAEFDCYPLMYKIGSVNERVLKFTDKLTGAGNATIAVNNDAYTLTTSGGSTVTGTLPTGERKYRIIAYSEQIPTITLGGASVQEDSVFTLPASGTITISGAGQGYFELWHDTREVRL